MATERVSPARTELTVVAIIPNGLGQFVLQGGDFPNLVCSPEHRGPEGTLMELGKRVVGVALSPDYARPFRTDSSRYLLYLTKRIDPKQARLAEDAGWAEAPEDERLKALRQRFPQARI